MGEGKWVVFMHRGAGSTIGCLLMALFRRPPVEGGRQTIFHSIDLKLGSHLNFLLHNSRRTTFPTLTQRPGAVICYVMGEGKRVVFMHRGAGSTIGCLVWRYFDVRR